MGKKFMIVKPTICCGNNTNIGKVFISSGDIEFKGGICGFCKHVREENHMLVPKYENGRLTYTEQSRIIWLHDESDVIEHDEKLEITA